MALIRTGSGSDVIWDLDGTLSTGPVSFRTPEYQAGGQGGVFRVKLTSGTIAAGQVAGMLFAFVNPSANNLCCVYNVSIGFATIAANTAGSVAVGLWATRSYTTLDTTGAATAPTLVQQRLDPTSNYQMQANYRIVNTTTLSGGTGTDDSQALAGLTFGIPSIISSMPLQSFFSSFPTGDRSVASISGLALPNYPLILAQNEGFRIRNDTAFAGGTDTEACIVVVDWVEMPTTGAGF